MTKTKNKNLLPLLLLALILSFMITPANIKRGEGRSNMFPKEIYSDVALKKETSRGNANEVSIATDPKFSTATQTATATITAYSKAETCPLSPCIMASGKLAYHGAIACPRKLPFGTKVIVGDITYTCEDRTHIRFDGRYDIFMDSYQDAIEWGKQILPIQILK